ncbi:MAG: SH3 domain-containing protein [Proteobacteria bacterium]|nr:SH3 domain-containing protein [Pseudomonadota bacterium]
MPELKKNGTITKSLSQEKAAPKRESLEIGGRLTKGDATRKPADVQKQDNPIGTATVTCSSLNVRSGAGANYPRIGGLSKGKTVQVYESSNGWLKIAYGSGFGWISAKYTDYKEPTVTEPDPVTEPEPPKTETFEVVVSVSNSLNVRTGPGTSYDKIDSLKNGDRVTVLEEKDGWYRISYNNGKEGWISAQYTYKPGEVSTAGQTAADYARTLMSRCINENWHYNQSKRQTDGYYDCSAFTHRCWSAAGLSLGWNCAAEQARIIIEAGGRVNSTNDIQPGDLLFWSYKSNGRYLDISHVAIAVGGGKRIDAGGEPVKECGVGTPLRIARPTVLMK